MIDPMKVAGDYIDIWNELDAEQRRVMLQRGWNRAATYVDPLGAAEGLVQVEQLIGSVQTSFPGHLFTLRGKPDGHGNHARFSWTLSDGGGSPIAGGTDVVLVEDAGRIVSVVGFLDEAVS